MAHFAHAAPSISVVEDPHVRSSASVPMGEMQTMNRVDSAVIALWHGDCLHIDRCGHDIFDRRCSTGCVGGTWKVRSRRTTSSSRENGSLLFSPDGIPCSLRWPGLQPSLYSADHWVRHRQLSSRAQSQKNGCGNLTSDQSKLCIGLSGGTLGSQRRPIFPSDMWWIAISVVLVLLRSHHMRGLRFRLPPRFSGHYNAHHNAWRRASAG